MKETFNITSVLTGMLITSVEIDVSVDTSSSTKLGLAVRAALSRSVNLCGADLRGADLCGADLRGADLRSANLCGADLCGADLCGADLCGADLRGADLRGADLRGSKNAEFIIAQTRILPDEGDLVGWKKCQAGVIVKLLVPAKAKRSHAFGRKCRSEFVKVLAVFNGETGISQYDPKTKYVVGKTVKCDAWDDNWQEECTGGIHFFITRAEAEAY